MKVFNASLILLFAFSVSAAQLYTVSPTLDLTKCITPLSSPGGTYANGVPIVLNDCNGAPSQKWQWIGNSLVNINTADNTNWCIDAGNVPELANGVRTKIWQCFDNLPQQTWEPIATSGSVKLSVGNYCLDLTDGITATRNPVQIWGCANENPNQIWQFTATQ